MKRKASRIIVTRNGKEVTVEQRVIRGNADLERAKRKVDRLVKVHRLNAVFQR